LILDVVLGRWQAIVGCSVTVLRTADLVRASAGHPLCRPWRRPSAAWVPPVARHGDLMPLLPGRPSLLGNPLGVM
jgi:hypothetical protein